MKFVVVYNNMYILDDTVFHAVRTTIIKSNEIISFGFVWVFLVAMTAS